MVNNQTNWLISALGSTNQLWHDKYRGHFRERSWKKTIYTQRHSPLEIGHRHDHQAELQWVLVQLTTIPRRTGASTSV
jgi:hypothetical protein